VLAGRSARKLAAAGEMQPGDVIVVHATSLVMRLMSWWPWYLSKWNHIAVYHHVDDAGTQWAIEATPGGVAWRKVADLGRVITNADQPKTDQQRAVVVAGIYSMLKMPYDWTAIEREAFRAVAEAGASWDGEWDGVRPPTHVICSSMASYWYWQAKLPGPHSWLSTPKEWAVFVDSRVWEHAAA
jgi:hypothetical protein